MSGKSKPYSAPGYGTSAPSPSYSSGKKGSDSSKGSDDIYNYSSGRSEAGPIYGGVPFFKTFNGVSLLK